MPKTFYITTPIYYVNDKPHIGHAYTTIACDVLARFKRLDGFQVKFLSGTDEHGQKVAKAARDQGIEPIDLCDRNSKNFRDLAGVIGASNDDFIRTTEPRHIAACQALWKDLEKSGHIYLAKYAGWYAVRDEAFYDEGELTKGPSGDKLAPSGAPVEWVEEESYFFKLSAFQEPLLKFYDANPDFIGPKSRFNEVYSFVKGGLRDLSISRTTFSWGVAVPGNEKHVMYVWIDALTNYIAALGYPDKTKDYAAYWPHAMHVVGKDIIRFHCVYWPAFLMAANLAPPKRVFAHGWWTVEGQKMSKSLGNAIDPNALIEKYGLDQIRYFLMREIPFGNDGDFSESAISGRINGELANEFGNLAQRGLGFIAKTLGSVLPAPGAYTPEDNEILKACAELIVPARVAMDAQGFDKALDAIWAVVRAANQYVDKQAPWALKKTDPARMNTVLYVMAEIVRHLAIIMQPFVPTSANKMLDQLGVAADARSFAHLGRNHALKGGTTLPAPSPVFPRYVPPGESKPGKST
ncbi:MAG: methionine--tRNA ligase [Rhodospirillaceae bacterium]|nr:methionine--tRNA ligase [Rhodospirillaceae bacterium]